ARDRDPLAEQRVQERALADVGTADERDRPGTLRASRGGLMLSSHRRGSNTTAGTLNPCFELPANVIDSGRSPASISFFCNVFALATEAQTWPNPRSPSPPSPRRTRKR